MVRGHWRSNWNLVVSTNIAIALIRVSGTTTLLPMDMFRAPMVRIAQSCAFRGATTLIERRAHHENLTFLAHCVDPGGLLCRGLHARCLGWTVVPKLVGDAES